MPGDVTKPVASGNPVRPSAQWQNRVNRAIKKSETSDSSLSAGQAGIRQPQGLIYVQNNSGEDRKRFEVLGVDNILYGPDDNKAEFQNNAALTGVTPVESQHFGNFVICAEPIAAGAVGRAFIFGVCPVQIDIQNVSDGFADVDNNEPGQLKSGTSGAAQILWTENDENGADDTGIMWALVRLSGPGPQIVITAKLTSKSGTRYAWSEAEPDSTTGTWSVNADGKSGTITDKPAIDLDSTNTVDWTGNFVVLVPVSGSDGKPCYVIAERFGYSGTVNVVTAVSWDGTSLKQTTTPLVFVGGLLRSVGSTSTTTIDTPTVC